MSDAPLFYCPDLASSETTPTLSPDEARHVAAQRLRVGDAVALFDGRGRGARAHIASLSGRGRDVAVDIDERFDAPAPSAPLMLYSAFPKGERLATLLEMATQLGMTHFTPLLCERSVVQPGANWQQRARRIAIEACKQSRRWHLPIVQESMPIAAALAHAREKTGRLWFAHPSATEAPSADEAPGGIALFVGPEGGFTDAEIDAAERAGATRVSLGRQILRIETAAVALLALARDPRLE